MIQFIFDLDGTVTSKETLPIIAKHFNIVDDLNKLTDETVSGSIPFVESFIKRVYKMADLPVDVISELLREVPLYSKVINFIASHNDQCVITTGNPRCWIGDLCNKIGCVSYMSEALVQNNRVLKLTDILKKEKVVKQYQDMGYTVVFIGEGINDLEAMRQADISIASGLTHRPANSVLGIADYVIYEEEALCRQLNQLL